MAEKKVLLDVDIKMTQAIKELGDLRMKMDELRQAQKECDKSTAEGNAEYSRLSIALGIAKKEYAALEKQVSQTIRIDQMKEGALEAQRLKLSNLTAEYAKMSKAERESADGMKLQQKIKALSDEIRGNEESLGDWRRNVGHYEKAANALKGELADLLKTLQSLKQGGNALASTTSSLSTQAKNLESQISEMELAIHSTGDASEEETKLMVSNLEELKQQLGQVYGSLEELGESQSLDGFAQSVSAVTGTVGLFTSTLSMNDKMGAEYAKTMQTLQKVATALASVQMLLTATQQKGALAQAAMNVLQKVGYSQTAHQIKAETALLALKSKGNILTKAGTAIQWAWNAALAANPVMLIVVAIAALVAGVAALYSALNDTAMEKAEKAQADYERQVRRTTAALDELSLKEMQRQTELSRQYNAEIQEMIKNGASKEQIAKKEEEFRIATLENECKAIEERSKVEDKAINDAIAYHRKLQAGIAQAKREATGWFTVDQKAIDDYMAKVDEAAKAVDAAQRAKLQSTQDLATKRTEIAKASLSSQTGAADKAYQAMQDYYSRYLAWKQAKLNQEYSWYYDASKTELQNEAEKFKKEQELAAASYQAQLTIEQKKLKLQLKYGKITKKAYNEQMATLAIESTNFLAKQVNALDEFNRKTLNSIISMAGGKKLDDQIKDIEAKYKYAAEVIKNDANLSADEKAYYEKMLADKCAKEIASVRQAQNDNANKDILQGLDETYKDDVRKFSASAETKLGYEIEYQKELIRKRKEAGLTTYEEEVRLAQLEYELRSATLNKKLQLNWKNANEQFKIRKKFLEDELALENLTAEQRAALEQELAQLQADYNAQRIADVENYANQVMEIASALNDVLCAFEDRKLQKAEENHSKEKADLDEQLAAGVISQKKYDKEVAKLDKDLDDKKAEIARKQAIREKVMGAVQIGINTAMAIMKIWAEVPKFDFGVSTGVLTGLVTALGAAQLAAVLATPIPTARKGGKIQGATHEQGGVLVNTEDQERIISSNPAKAFPELLNLISYIGKHANMPNTGYSVRSFANAIGGNRLDSNIDYDMLANKFGISVGEAIKGLQIYLSLQEFKKAQDEQMRIEESSKM